MNKKEEHIMTFGDLFCGAGGTTTGALSVKGIKVAWALNHSREAIYTHELNHPETVHYHADIKDMDEHKLCQVDGLWASLECTNFSNAKGGLPREEDSRTLAWELVRYITWCKPKYIVIENVREFMSWGPLDNKGKPLSRDKGKDYLKWIQFIKNLGYPNYDFKILNSADYGAHTARKRYFGIFSVVGCEISFPKPLLDKKHYKACKEKIDLENTGQSIFGRKKPLAEKTLQRIAAGIKKFYPEMAHVMQYYGNGYNGQSITVPLNTITTKERHGLVNFVANYSYNNTGSSLDEPLKTITTKESHALIQFGVEYNGDSDAFSVDKPLRAITTKQKHALASVEKKQFVSDHIWGSSNQSIEKPLNTVCTKESKQLVTVGENPGANKEEKYQFITKYFSGVPHQKCDSLDKPLSTILTVNRHALATILMNGDFDIRLRFLTPKELADITGFPEDYKWYGSNKFKTWMIGNAVPVLLAKAIINETKKNYDARRCEDTPDRTDSNIGEVTNWRTEKSGQLGLFNTPQGLSGEV